MLLLVLLQQFNQSEKKRTVITYHADVFKAGAVISIVWTGCSAVRLAANATLGE